MHVDRATFLVLTSSLFAACKDEAPPVSAPIVIPLQPPAAPSATYVSAPPPLASADAGAKPEPARAEDDGEEEPPDWQGTARVPLARTVHPASCPPSDNQKGAAACALRAPPGPTCESFTSTKSECARLRTWLVPRAAEKTSQCLQGKSGKGGICLFNAGAACWIESLSSVCLDPSPKIETSCRDVLAKCAAVDKKYRHMTMDSCRAALSSIVPARHARFVGCAEESCDLTPCYYQSAASDAVRGPY